MGGAVQYCKCSPLVQTGFLGGSAGGAHTTKAVDWVASGDAPPNGEEREDGGDATAEDWRGEDRRAYVVDIHSDGSGVAD